jgi:hypothetical protein
MVVGVPTILKSKERRREWGIRVADQENEITLGGSGGLFLKELTSVGL